MAKKIRIDLKEGSYNILIGTDILENLKNLIRDNKSEQNYVITDKNVYTLYGHYINTLNNYEKIVVEPGEQSKTINVTTDIKTNAERSIRKSKITMGGVIGFAGFVALYICEYPYPNTHHTISS